MELTGATDATASLRLKLACNEALNLEFVVFTGIRKLRSLNGEFEMFAKVAFTRHTGCDGGVSIFPLSPSQQTKREQIQLLRVLEAYAR